MIIDKHLFIADDAQLIPAARHRAVRPHSPDPNCKQSRR
ncbi:hypothetical protein predicted by Glimmer/Critica (plasmid) [Sinorhizobium fredii HH103]|uniref:Uncharacterized protein n=1 Tax=Sinorhizobium fredii (strain HH103) TaxID=1117943 RepID=G9AIP2_SINF1|nr:hypothetical protein predicted by Glimmer/Critica [Sinorhizobium fredii HH103]